MLIKLDSGAYVNSFWITGMRTDAMTKRYTVYPQGLSITEADRDRIVETMNSKEATDDED